MQLHGAYGVTVNTEVCGTFDSGSIPDRPPIQKFPEGDFCIGGLSTQTALRAIGD